jgi:hypothetical protein
MIIKRWPFPCPAHYARSRSPVGVLVHGRPQRYPRSCLGWLLTWLSACLAEHLPEPANRRRQRDARPRVCYTRQTTRSVRRQPRPGTRRTDLARADRIFAAARTGWWAGRTAPRMSVLDVIAVLPVVPGVCCPEARDVIGTVDLRQAAEMVPALLGISDLSAESNRNHARDPQRTLRLLRTS